MLGNFSGLFFFAVCRFFSKLIFPKKSCKNIFIVSNNLDPYQARQNVGPDMGPSCLQRLSADDGSSFFKINLFSE